MVIVMPRAISSGARSMPSNETNRLTSGYRSASTLVIAAVRVVLPWSTWPIVPMFRCGLCRRYWLLAMESPYLAGCFDGPRNHVDPRHDTGGAGSPGHPPPWVPLRREEGQPRAPLSSRVHTPVQTPANMPLRVGRGGGTGEGLIRRYGAS